MAQGNGFSQAGELAREVFDAIAAVPEQVDELEYKTNAQRAVADVLARNGVS